MSSRNFRSPQTKRNEEGASMDFVEGIMRQVKPHIREAVLTTKQSLKDGKLYRTRAIS